MAVKVGELFARLTLQDAEFKKKLQEAEGRLKDLAKASSAAFAAIGGAITAATVSAGRYADEIMAVSGRTGLAVESVQALSYAAMRLNADFGLLQASLRAFVRRAAEAADGNTAFLATYEQLGITQQEVAQGLHDIEGLFLLVAERIADLPTEAQRSAAAMQLLGDAGRQLVPMLSQGASGLRAVMQEARQLGIVTSRETIESLADFAGEVDVLRAQLTGAARALLAEFVPTLRTGVGYLSQAADAVANLNEEKRRLIAVIGTGTLGAVGAFAGLTTAVWGASRAMQGLASVFRLASGPAGWIALVGSAVFSLTAGFMAAQTAMKATREEIIRFGSLGDVEREIEKVTAEIEAIHTQLERLRTPQIGGPSIRFFTEEGMQEELQNLNDDLERLIARREELIRLEREQKQFLDQLNEAVISASATTRSLSDILADHEKRLENVRVLSELLGDSFDTADEQLRAFERTIVDAVESGHAHAQSILEIAEAYREMVEAARLAQQETSRMIMPLSDLARWVEIIDLRRRMGMTLPTRPDHFLGDLPQDIEWQAWRMLSDIAGELREEFERLTAEGKGFSEAALDILRVLERVTREVEELEAKLRRQEPIPVTPPLPSPMAAPTITRDEARMAEFMERAREDLRRLAEQVQAGLMPTQEAIRLLFQWRAQMIGLAGPLGGLINLNAEQLSLYNALNEALQRWVDSLQETPTRLEQIREDMERALGVGRAVEEEIARATGVRFDPITYEMEVLARTIREMADATGEITPEMERMLLNLSRLSREHEALTTTEALVRTALDGFGTQLGDIGRLLSRSITFEAGRGLGGFGFDPTAFMTGAVSTGISLLFQAIGGIGETSTALERAAQALESASESWRRTLAEAQFHELITATPESQIEELRRARASAQHEIAMLERRWLQFWNASARSARISELRDAIREIDQMIRQLEEGWAGDLEARIEEILGVTTRGLQSAVAGAFSAATAEEFAKNIEDALTARIRNAWVTAFLESATMAPLFEELRDMIREALMDVDISPDEMEGIRVIMDEIKRQSEPLYELLDEMGLLADVTERVNREFERLVNVPLGFRTLQALRFQSMTPGVVPTLAGIQGANGGAMIIENMTVVSNDPLDFERKLRDYQRRYSLRRSGNPTAFERVGR